MTQTEMLRDMAQNMRNYGLRTKRGALLAAAREIENLQAQVDALMLEFCPDEMTDEQRANWARHQRPANDKVQQEVTAAMGSNVK